MTSMNDRVSRRTLLSRLVLGTGLTVVTGHAAAQTSTKPAAPAAKPAAAPAAAPGTLPKLDEKDPIAVALGYVADAARVDAKKNPTFKAGQICGNCLQVKGKDGEAYRPCAIFPGKLVANKGWCKTWTRLPAAKA
jgi:hypothetical protein